MKKRKKGRKFSRKKDQRKALFKALTVSLLNYGKIKTTEAKAKELKKVIEPLISRAKTSTLSNRRQLLKFLPAKTVKKLMEEIAVRYKNRKGGYTRVVKLSPRPSDGAKMAIIELVK